MSKYQRGKIYTIKCKTNNNYIYVGSTIEKYLSKRFCNHKYKISSGSCSLYQFINNPENNTNWDDWYIELYEEYPCNSKIELVKRENEIIRQIGTINKRGYKDFIKSEYNKEYQKQNNERLKEYRKNYYNKRKDEMKKYREDNKEKMKKYQKEYREKK